MLFHEIHLGRKMCTLAHGWENDTRLSSQCCRGTMTRACPSTWYQCFTRDVINICVQGESKRYEAPLTTAISDHSRSDAPRASCYRFGPSGLSGKSLRLGLSVARERSATHRPCGSRWSPLCAPRSPAEPGPPGRWPPCPCARRGGSRRCKASAWCPAWRSRSSRRSRRCSRWWHSFPPWRWLLRIYGLQREGEVEGWGGRKKKCESTVPWSCSTAIKVILSPSDKKKKF